MSLSGERLLSTWVISESSKHLTTWTSASTSARFDKNLLPRPSPLLAPFTSPAISTNSNWLDIIEEDSDILAIVSSLGSLTATFPTFGSIVQKG